MRIAPLSRNLLSAGTVSTSVRAFERGLPVTALWTDDPLERARFRGTFVIPSGLKSNFTTTAGVLTASITAGTYYSAAEFGAQIAADHSAADGGALWFCAPIQGTDAADGIGGRRWLLRRATGTSSLQIASGSDTAANVLKLVLGFGGLDRATGQDHYGHMPAIHYPRERVLIDLGSAKGANFGAVVAPKCSPGGVFSVAVGAAVSGGEITSPTVYTLGDAADDEILTACYTASARYVELRLEDPRGWSVPRPEVGLWWHGQSWDTDDAYNFARLEWEATSYKGSVASRYLSERTLTGNLAAVEIEPGERFSVAFMTHPGFGPSEVPGLQRLVRDLGTDGAAIVALMPTDSPNQESMLCRLASLPKWERIPVSRLSRWSCTFEFIRQAVR